MYPWVQAKTPKICKIPGVLWPAIYGIPSEIMKEIEFFTIKCRMGAATQRQYLEARFPEQMIYDNDLYQAIQHFHPQNKDNSNDAARLYTKLLELSQNNPM